MNSKHYTALLLVLATLCMTMFTGCDVVETTGAAVPTVAPTIEPETSAPSDKTIISEGNQMVFYEQDGELYLECNNEELFNRYKRRNYNDGYWVEPNFSIRIHAASIEELQHKIAEFDFTEEEYNTLAWWYADYSTMVVGNTMRVFNPFNVKDLALPEGTSLTEPLIWVFCRLEILSVRLSIYDYASASEAAAYFQEKPEVAYNDFYDLDAWRTAKQYTFDKIDDVLKIELNGIQTIQIRGTHKSYGYRTMYHQLYSDHGIFYYARIYNRIPENEEEIWSVRLYAVDNSYVYTLGRSLNNASEVLNIKLLSKAE